MKNRNVFAMLPLLAVTMCLLGGNAHAVLIDDFNGADFSVPANRFGVNLPYANAIGGWRMLQIMDNDTGDSLEVSGGVLTLTEAVAEQGDSSAESSVFWQGTGAISPLVDLTDGGSSDRVRVDITAVDPRCIAGQLPDTAQFAGELTMSVLSSGGGSGAGCASELTQDLGQPGPYDFPFADFRANCPFEGFETIGRVTLVMQASPRPSEDAIACVVIDQIETVGPAQGNQAPRPDPNGPYTGAIESAIVFDGSGSSDPDGTIMSYDWDFGDNTSGTGVSPSHTYTESGTYNVTLTVTDDSGETDDVVTTATIAEGNQPPVADPNGPYTGTAGEAITFDGTGSSDPDGTIEIYDWDFGDGTPVAEDAGANPSYTYAEEETYHVTLTVTDDSGVSNSVTTLADIERGNQPPDCSAARPSIGTIWPSQQAFDTFIAITIQGVIDPDGDPVSITTDSIFQDEPVGLLRDGRDVGTNKARVRAHRLGQSKGGNGRFYHIGYTARDGLGGSCSGEVLVRVTLRSGQAVDDGANFDSTVPSGDLPPDGGDVVRVFIASGGTNSNMGGLAGADAFCQEKADIQAFGGTWTAWLSDSTNDARDRIPDGRYELLNGIVIAEDKADLTDGSLNAPILLTDQKEILINEFDLVWTGTNADGTRGSNDLSKDDPEAFCGDWTSPSDPSASPPANTVIGAEASSRVTGEWTSGRTFNCFDNRPFTIYCFGTTP